MGTMPKYLIFKQPFTPRSVEKIDRQDDESFKIRSSFFKGHAIIEVKAPLHIDLFLQDRYLINLIDFKL